MSASGRIAAFNPEDRKVPQGMSTFEDTPRGGDQAGKCTDPGNPVFSCMQIPAFKTPPMLWVKAQHPLYKTTSSVYGARPVTSECLPSSYRPRSQRFSRGLGLCGMYSDTSLNTALDRSRVYDNPNLQHTL